MTDKLSIQKITAEFRRTGWISFWVQIVLAVVSTLIILFATLSNSFKPDTPTSGPSPGSGFGLFFAVLGLIALYGATFWAYRYTQFSQQLQAKDPDARPSRATAMTLLKQGVMWNLGGLFLIVIGAQAIVGSLVAKSFQQTGAIFGDPQGLVQPLDLFVVQANTNTITAHVAGLVASLWLLNRVSR